MTLGQAVSLFAGVEGIGIALKRAGFTVAAHCEIDPQAISICRRQFPQAISYTDVRTLTGDQLAADGIRPRLIAAGFPCQDLSIAGRRAGLGGGRSGLFFEIARLLAETAAEWLYLENVPGLLSSVCPCAGGQVRADGSCLAAARAAAVLRRRKHPDTHVPDRITECPGGHQVPGGGCLGGCMAVHGGAMGAVLGTLGELGYGLAYRVLDAQHFGVPQRRRRVNIVGRLGDWAAPAEVLLEPEGSAGDLAARRAQRTPVAGATDAGTDRRRGARGLSPTVTAKWAKGTGGPSGDEAQNLTIVSTVQGGAVAATGSTRKQQPADTWNATRTGAGGAGTSGLGSGQEGAPASTIGTSVTQAVATYRKSTRAASPEHDETWVEDNTLNTLYTFDIGDTRATSLIVEPTVQVRRLTPLECERLQGFPDNWTRENEHGAPYADGPRYRFMGNAVAIPPTQWVIDGIAAIIEREATSATNTATEGGHQ